MTNGKELMKEYLESILREGVITEELGRKCLVFCDTLICLVKSFNLKELGIATCDSDSVMFAYDDFTDHHVEFEILENGDVEGFYMNHKTKDIESWDFDYEEEIPMLMIEKMKIFKKV